MKKELYDRITVYLKKYGNEKGLQVVLKFDPTSDCTVCRTSIGYFQGCDHGLNAEYKLEKSGTGAESRYYCKKVIVYHILRKKPALVPVFFLYLI